MLLVAILLNTGCADSGPVNAVAAANDSNLKRLSNLYQSFASRYGWRGPKDEAEFREFMGNRGFGIKWADGAGFAKFMDDGNNAMGVAMKAAGLAKT